MPTVLIRINKSGCEDQMNNQACAPCSRRKVRCDKGQPCSNCKRRKQDQCTYSESTPLDKIRKLEALVRDLGGDPEDDTRNVRRRTEATPLEPSPTLGTHRRTSAIGTRTVNPGNPVMVEDDGQPYYLESSAWHSWVGAGESEPVSVHQSMSRGSLWMARQKPSAFQSLTLHDHSIDLMSRHPSPQDAGTLWDIYERNVNPLVKISFTWALKSLHAASVHPEDRKNLSNGEHALLFSMYLISIISLPEEDCLKDLGQSKSGLLSEYQMLCEQALTRSNLLCISDPMVLKALTLYITAEVDRMSTQSLWSLMGLVIRNAEKLGMHRDGGILGLSPLETEERRRLWWQLQHIDLFLSIRSGSTSMTLMADWDTKLPLNIEDDDINADMTKAPPERKGLTSISYGLWTYWVIQKQRVFFHNDKGRLGVSWTANKSIPHATKHKLIDEMEDGLNQRFLQYCDPIHALDTIVQLGARSLMCGLRLFTLHPLAYSGDSSAPEGERREQLLDACMKLLEYNVAMHSQPSIRHFLWRIEGSFPWPAFICVLVEVSQQKDMSKVQRIWKTLSDLYTNHKALSQFSEDRRKFHAAELVVAAWKVRANSADSAANPSKPAFVTNLETRLMEFRTESAQRFDVDVASQDLNQQMLQQITPESFLSEQDLNAILDLDFPDIDWAFWSSIE